MSLVERIEVVQNGLDVAGIRLVAALFGKGEPEPLGAVTVDQHTADHLRHRGDVCRQTAEQVPFGSWVGQPALMPVVVKLIHGDSRLAQRLRHFAASATEHHAVT
jgi:hypothetical protein